MCTAETFRDSLLLARLLRPHSPRRHRSLSHRYKAARCLPQRKTVAEGAGAIALAAVLQAKTGHRGKNIAVLVSGGNLDVNLLARIIEQGLVWDGRRLRLRVRLPDYPGELEGLASVIAKARANIVETLYNRAHYGVSLNEAAIDITMETRGRDHASDLLAALTGSRYELSVVE